MLIHHPFERAVGAAPNKVALVCGRRRLTYADLEARSNRLAHALRAAGVRGGDRVAVCLENGPEAVVAWLAAAKAGGVFLFISPLVKPDKRSFILADSGARALLASPQTASTLQGPLPDLRIVIVTEDDRKPEDPIDPTSSTSPSSDATSIDPASTEAKRVDPTSADGSRSIERWDEFVRGAPEDRPETHRIDADLASIFYTSGSTGAPKGVMLTHLNMRTAAASITQYLGLTAGDVTLTFSSLATDYGWYNVVMALGAGGTAVLEPAFVHPGQLVQCVARERVTGVALVPTIAAILLKFPQLRAADLSGVRYVTSTGQALPPRHVLDLQSLFAGARIFSMYGLTECKRVSYLDPAEIQSRPGSVGKAIPNTEVFLVDDEGRRIDAPDKVGELIVRGSHVMRGYWRRPEETAARLMDGDVPGEKVLRTGDLFRMDAEGFLYFVGRKDDLFKSGGQVVSPKEVETVLHELPGVVEAVVIGVPDELLGNAIKAVLAVEAGSALTAGDVTAHCRARLEPYLVPRHVELCERLPKTLAGKTDRRSPLLREVGA
jgi:long-chain acyl-CoA synthetase